MKSSLINFKRQNYQLIAVAVVVQIIGYILMCNFSEEQNTENIFGFTNITLAPIVILIGYILVIFAIMKKFEKA